MHRLRLCCIALGLFACSQSEPGPVAPWVNAITPAEHDRFFPIQSGPHALTCNTCHGGTQSFQAGPGWDYPTGWGAPKASAIVTAFP